MDKSSYEERRQYWSEIIAQCQARPEGQSAKQWLKENRIRETTYYLWRRRIRQDMYGQPQADEATDRAFPAGRTSGEVVFAELPRPVKACLGGDAFPHTDAAATIKAGNILIGITRDIPPGLLEVILREAFHA